MSCGYFLPNRLYPSEVNVPSPPSGFCSAILIGSCAGAVPPQVNLFYEELAELGCLLKNGFALACAPVR